MSGKLFYIFFLKKNKQTKWRIKFGTSFTSNISKTLDNTILYVQKKKLIFTFLFLQTWLHVNLNLRHDFGLKAFCCLHGIIRCSVYFFVSFKRFSLCKIFFFQMLEGFIVNKMGYALKIEITGTLLAHTL